MMHRPRQLASFVFAATLCATLPCLAQTAPARYPLTADAVAGALTAAGAPVTAADITMPSALTCMSLAPHLTLQSTGLSGPAQLRVRVTCAGAGQCLPFMVLADLHDPTTALAAHQKLTPQPPSSQLAQHAAANVLRAGQHATLLLEDGHMRISLPVISIDTGATGTEIRVASLDRKQTYRGTVTDADTVRGALP